MVQSVAVTAMVAFKKLIKTTKKQRNFMRLDSINLGAPQRTKCNMKQNGFTDQTTLSSLFLEVTLNP